MTLLSSMKPLGDFGFGESASSCLPPLFSAHRVALWEYDPQKREVAFSQDYTLSLGLDRIGLQMKDLDGSLSSVHAEDRPAFEERLRAALASPGVQPPVIYRRVGPQGEVWLEDHLFSCPTQGPGTPVRLISFTSRADLLHQQQERIEALETQYRKLVNTLPDFIFVFDENFIFQDIIMPEGMSLLHPREELLGTSGRAIFTQEVSDLYVANIRECLHTGQMKVIEYYLLIGEIKYYFEARIVPFEDNKIFALIHDIGDRVRRMGELVDARHRAEEADRMKSAFLANMSHEIRTPLNAIVGFAEVLSTEEDPAARMEYMDIIRSNSELLLQLINDILDLSRIESGRYEMNFQNTEINLLMREVEQSNRFKVQEGVELRVEFPSRPIWVLTDPKRVTQVLFNLLSNAVKNTSRGSITLRVEEQEEYLRFSVIDTGCGIPPERVRTIFQRFEKLNDFVQGTGLGLAISQGLVERLGGNISVESTLGEGSAFSFTIPYRQDAPPASAEDVPGEAAGPRRKKILVADDSEENFEFIREHLAKNHDVEFLWAADGEQAVGRFVLEKPDLILMNIQLPVLSGLEATQKIRAMSASVPIIGITTNAFYMEQQWALESGCNDIISKPYSVTRLEEVVLAFL